MRTILFIIQKEFIQIRRNRSMLPVIFIIPIVQLIILVNAATLEMKHINLEVVDQDLSSTSRQLTQKFSGSPFFILNKASFSKDEAISDLTKDKTDVILEIPAHFERDLLNKEYAEVQVIINAINGTAGDLSNAYVLSIIEDYNQTILTRWKSVTSKGIVINKHIDQTINYWYNPDLNYKEYMVPAVLVILVTIIGAFLCALNLVREKELGTIEQINVTPIHKYQFIAGKLVPFWIIGMCELGFGLIIAKLLFSIPMLGSLWLLFGVAGIYLLVVMGFGLFISTVTETQQQSMFIAFFFILVFILMGGIFTAPETMPKWTLIINYFNPIAYFMKIVRMILLKGSGFIDIRKEVGILSIYAMTILSLAVWRYKKVV